MEKVTKNDLTIISKPHAHPHTMKKTYAKFQNDRYKTVRGVALTRGFVCVEVLRPSQPNGSCQAQSFYLTTRLLGRLSPLSG